MSIYNQESEILKANPHISEEELAKRREMLAKLRGLGLRRPRYRIAIPYAGRRVSVEQDDELRTIHLRHIPSAKIG